MRIGILGGTFDPVHIGHLLVARDAAERLKLDRVLFLLAARPPHKRCVLPYAQRRRLLRRALRGHPAFVLSEIESQRPGPSYTVESLARLRAQYPDDRLFLLLGADQYRELCTWRHPERLGDFARLVVMTRPGARENQGTAHNRTIPDFPAQILPVRQVEIGSTEIRRRLAQALPVTDMVPDCVLELIVKDNLYQRRSRRQKKGQE